jgi:hypothetical protein
VEETDIVNVCECVKVYEGVIVVVFDFDKLAVGVEDELCV